MQIAVPSTPANYFHLLRRQLHRNFRKPLVVMTPKSLLRHKLCISSLEDMSTGTGFRRVLPEIDHISDDQSVRKVILCSGKVYYDLLSKRREHNIENIAIVRIEQLYPFPKKALGVELSKYGNASVVWCQEEPRNMGAWTFVDRRIETMLAELGITKSPLYVGREEAASPATGSSKTHAKQQSKLVDEALGLD